MNVRVVHAHVFFRRKALPGPWRGEVISCMCGLETGCHSCECKRRLGSIAIVSPWKVSVPVVSIIHRKGQPSQLHSYWERERERIMTAGGIKRKSGFTQTLALIPAGYTAWF